mmetsp:Transcript_17416/g.37808  ORF Transcript_17416/g.37808 Transcript_17416/m.37808 type:complete len:292 (-) Transcript_17416:442-1317(-)
MNKQPFHELHRRPSPALRVGSFHVAPHVFHRVVLEQLLVLLSQLHVRQHHLLANLLQRRGISEQSEIGTPRDRREHCNAARRHRIVLWRRSTRNKQRPARRHHVGQRRAKLLAILAFEQLACLQHVRLRSLQRARRVVVVAVAVEVVQHAQQPHKLAHPRREVVLEELRQVLPAQRVEHHHDRIRRVQRAHASWRRVVSGQRFAARKLERRGERRLYHRQHVLDLGKQRVRAERELETREKRTKRVCHSLQRTPCRRGWVRRRLLLCVLLNRGRRGGHCGDEFREKLRPAL